MDLRELREHLDNRLDKLEDKLDNHLERISKAETSIEWLRGHAKLLVTLLITLLTTALGAVYQLVGK